MFAKMLSLLRALVITGATVLVTAEPAHAHPSGGYHRQVTAIRGYHHDGHYGRYYGGHYRRHHDRYYGGYHYYRPYSSGYRHPYRPYYGHDPNDYLRR